MTIIFRSSSSPILSLSLLLAFLLLGHTGGCHASNTVQRKLGLVRPSLLPRQQQRHHHRMLHTAMAVGQENMPATTIISGAGGLPKVTTNGTKHSTAAAAPAPAPAPAIGVCAGDPLCGNPVSVGWYQAHGWLMWLGFGVLMPLGIITSRHLQTVTPHWFYIHIGLMTTAMTCIIAGASISFALFEAIPGTPSGDPAYLHITMGTATFLMACLNFLMGLGRPHKGVPSRVFWYLCHFTVGTVTVLLSWYVIFTGMNIYEANWVIGTGSGLPDLNLLKDLFTVNIVIMAYAYLLLGRWDYMLGQRDEDSRIDGVTRYSSTMNLAQK